jgi:hypothetical protein
VVDIERQIHGSEKLISIYGRWPSFHDAYVHEALLSRGAAAQGAQRLLASLTAKIHLFEMTSEIDAQGYYVLRNHNIATLKFDDISELDLRDFNGANILFSLAIEVDRSDSMLFTVGISTSCGLYGGFQCKRIEVIDLRACSPNGVETTP